MKDLLAGTDVAFEDRGRHELKVCPVACISSASSEVHALIG